MGVNSNQYLQGINQTTGTGAPVHSAVAGDRYTDTATGITYQYTTSWQTVSYSAGGLTYFTEAQSTASPNATVNVDSLTAVASTTNADFVVKPKGTGAVIAAIPDNLTTGGNKRGANAVDLQTNRSGSGAAYVASGLASVLCGGADNRSTNIYSSVLGGNFNSATGQYSSQLGGYSNTISGNFSSGGGATINVSGTGSFAFGSANTVSSDYCAALGGGHTLSQQYCFAGNTGHNLSNFYSTAFGSANNASGYANFMTGVNSKSFGVNMRQSIGGYQYTTAGDNQSSTLILSGRTTSETPKVLCSADPAFLASPSAINQMTLQDNSMMRIKGSISGKQSGSTNVGSWDFDCVIVRGANAGTTTIASSNVNLVVNTGTFGTPTITANTTIGCLTVTVTGIATTNIQWQAILLTSEIIYA